MSDYEGTSKIPFLRFRSLICWRTFKWLGVIIMLLPVIGYIGFHIWVERWFQSKINENNAYLTQMVSSVDQIYAENQEFWNTPVHFPPECFETPVNSEELDEACKKAETQWQKIRGDIGWDYDHVLYKWQDRIFSPQGLSPADWNHFKQDLSKIGPFIEASLESAGKMESVVSNHAPGAKFPALPDGCRNFDSFICFKLKAIALTHENHPEEAAEYLSKALVLMIANPYHGFYFYSNNFGLISEIVQTFEDLLPSIKSPQCLQNTLDRLNRIEPYLFQGKSHLVNELKLIDHLRNIQKYGPVDLTPGKKASFYIQQLVDHRYKSKLLKDLLEEMYMDWMSGAKPSLWEQERNMRELSRYLLFPRAAREYFFLRMGGKENPTAYQAREHQIGNQFDFLRLRIAGELYFIETGKYPVRTSDLVPKYFSEVIKNRETDQPRVWENGVPKR